MSAAGDISAARASVLLSSSKGNGGAFASASGSVTASDSLFAAVSSSAGLGGALFASANATLAGASIVGALAALQGGGVYARNVVCSGRCAFTRASSLRQVRG